MVINLLEVVGKIKGSFFIGGEMMSCFFRSFNLMNSSKVSLISFPLKLVLKFFGKLAFKTGAMVSFSPPVIDPLLAQPMVSNRSRSSEIYLKLFFNITDQRLDCAK